MSMTSFLFFVLVGILVLLYYILPGRCQIYLLMLGSVVFCWSAGGVRMLVFLTFSIFTTWIGGMILGGTHKSFIKNMVLLLVLAANLGILFITKYINFFILTGNAVGRLLGRTLNWESVTFIAPLGISFYTLQVIGYLLDVSRGTCLPQKNLIKYAAFAGFFPQLVQGPINRYAEMEESLYAVKKFDVRRISFGLQRMLWGLFKKLVIAERMTVIVDTVYGDYITYNGCYIIVATICFAFQLYTDFSGAMDIALGVSEMLGVKMSENFDNPFFARSISEYWRKWHITLGTWMKDYIFYPVLKSDLLVSLGDWAKKRFGKKKGKKVPLYIGMVILWFTVGMWHGGSWKYIIGSGLLHCFYIVSGQMLEPLFKKLIRVFDVNVSCFSFRLFQTIRTFFLVCVGFVFFRADSAGEALRMLRETAHCNIWILSDGSLLNLGLDIKNLTAGICSLGILLLVSLLQQRFHREGKTVRSVLAEQNLVFRWLIYYGLFFSIVVLGFYGPGYDASAFIYQGF